MWIWYNLKSLLFAYCCLTCVIPANTNRNTEGEGKERTRKRRGTNPTEEDKDMSSFGDGGLGGGGASSSESPKWRSGRVAICGGGGGGGGRLSPAMLVQYIVDITPKIGSFLHHQIIISKAKGNSCKEAFKWWRTAIKINKVVFKWQKDHPNT